VPGAEDLKLVAGSVVAGERPCVVDPPGPFLLVLFGATGDLTRRKIMPALYRLFHAGHLPEAFAVVGAGRSQVTDAAFRKAMREAAEAALPGFFLPEAWREFAPRLSYRRVEYDEAASFARLRRGLAATEKKFGTGGNRVFYLAVPPAAYEGVVEGLGGAGLLREQGGGFAHVVIEKPFGRDLASAERLGASIARWAEERQVFRMDHYLAKETVQNILMFRFANSIFEPLWNRRYIDSVEITATETLGVEHRAGYYEGAGVLRDMFQNHIFQLLALTAMEPPSVFEAERVRDEKVKVFRSVRPIGEDSFAGAVVVGQYGRGTVEGREVPAYREDRGVSPESVTATYAAMRVYIDNWRWNGVPFFLRSGKRLAARKARIVVRFRSVPHLMFQKSMDEEIDPNLLVLRVQPDEGVDLHFQTKTPGSRVCLSPVAMDFSYPKVFLQDAYARALLDCVKGDRMLFVRSDGVRETWRLLDPVIERVEREARAKGIAVYEAGTDGPAAARALIARSGHTWHAL
jgi:glucose-6-phosphate 1-dehydrogenase